jgi:pyruvate-formate lyase-activating enzyme
MMISTIGCTWKCLVELGLDTSLCQNCDVAKMQTIDIDNQVIINRYLKNHITSAIVIGGLEPLLQIDEVLLFIDMFRKVSKDDIVVYTGYYHHEIMTEVKQLAQYNNIIIKFGRFIPDSISVFDEVLGINLISKNQYALKIS